MIYTCKRNYKIASRIIYPIMHSKTAAEVKVIRKELNLTDPYIVENGGAYGESPTIMGDYS